MEYFKPKVGQILYSLNVGNAARNREQILTKVIVTKVGRKYFTCQKDGAEYTYHTTVYHIKDWVEKTDYCRDSQLYLSQQQWEDEKEENSICNLMKDVLSMEKITQS